MFFAHPRAGGCTMGRFRGTTLLAVASLLAVGCSDLNEPLTPAGAVGGIVWDGSGNRVADAAIVVGYELEPEKDAVSSPGAPAARPADAGQVPTELRLYQNFPNPFSESSVLEFVLSVAGRVDLELFTHRGEPAATLMSGTELQAGRYQIRLSDLPNDVYVARLAFAVPGGTSYAVVHGITALDGDPLTAPPSTTTDATGEFFLPTASLACGIRVPLTAEEGPEITGWGRISCRLRLTARHEARTAVKTLLLQDDSALHFLEMKLQ
jgi:hypothetical protein